MTKEPTRPIPWANLLGQAWGNRFPVDVRTIALEYSTRFPDPIKTIAQAEVATFEGALYPLPKSGKWAILYNPNITSAGRINFTLAHEFGHYLCHRNRNPAGFECGEDRVLGIDSDATIRQIEQEADTFASYLLMPIDDYREQVGRSEMSLDLLGHASDRYGVSSTAAAIKWLDFTSKCAALVVATNGFVLWCWRSKAAKRRRIYFERGMPLPAASWAANPHLVASPSGLALPKNVWSSRSDAREMAIFADSYEMTISLVVFGEEEWGLN
ncbi:ImmA/IrrE family metallo-endopeptidase [Sphingobium indicum]|uniref:ImmA/IrrE family metallo-endopeptidase n=1 Tax=Sphingobium indicum TaxID=332055 RepID=UPI0035E58181